MLENRSTSISINHTWASIAWDFAQSLKTSYCITSEVVLDCDRKL